MHILSLDATHTAGAAALFAENYRRLRRSVPALPARMENPAACAEMLETLLDRSAGLAAVDGGRLVGYMGWWVVDNFRDAQHRVAYVPVWAHAAAGEEKAAGKITLALYSAASRIWHASGCTAYAASLLADDPLMHSFWFWNGFGALVVDAIRETGPLGVEPPGAGIAVRRAKTADAALLAQLEGEHWRHYAEPPVLMCASHPSGVEEMAALVASPRNQAWLAFADGEPAGYIRFEGSSDGASELVQPGPEESASLPHMAITGAFVRPAYRGRGAAPAMLDAALRGLAESVCPRCSVDFESINPEASALWMKYFTPITISVMRVPERS